MGLQSLPAPNTLAQRGARMEDHGPAWVSETSRGKASPGPRPLKGWRSRKVQGSRKMVFQKMARVPRIGGGRDTMTKGQILTQDRT